MAIMGGNWISPDTFNTTSGHLQMDAQRLFSAPEEYQPVFHEFSFFQDIPITALDEYGNDSIFAVYNERDLLNRVNEIHLGMIVRQDDYFAVGKCLRSFATNAIIRPLSLAGCALLQLLDADYMRIKFYFERISRCYQQDNSSFCKQIKQTNVLKNITDTVTFELEPAEEQVAHAFGMNREELIGHREELRFKTQKGKSQSNLA